MSDPACRCRASLVAIPFALGLAVLILAGAACSPVPEQPRIESKPWRSVLQGMELAGFTVEGPLEWTIARQGQLAADSGESGSTGTLWLPGVHGDFNLRFRYSTTADASIMVRVAPGVGDPGDRGYRVVLAGGDPENWYGIGSIRGIQPRRTPNDDEGGRPRSCLISAVGDRLTVVIDGQKTVDIHDRRSLQGAVGFHLSEPGKIQISELEVQPLPGGQSLPATLEAVMDAAPGGFVSLMPGPQLEGWRMLWPEDGKWTREGDDLVASDVTDNSWLFTEDNFRDFIFRLEFKTEGEANGGVIYRYPWPEETGARPGGPMARAAETQIIFNDREEPGAMHGRNTVRKGVADPNSWNRYALYCYDDRVAVYINGVKVTDWHNAVAREGALGLQSLGKDSVMRYRNLEIKRMPDGFVYP